MYTTQSFITNKKFFKKIKKFKKQNTIYSVNYSLLYYKKIYCHSSRVFFTFKILKSALSFYHQFFIYTRQYHIFTNQFDFYQISRVFLIKISALKNLRLILIFVLLMIFSKLSLRRFYKCKSIRFKFTTLYF
jgi:hypothetical protein